MRTYIFYIHREKWNDEYDTTWQSEEYKDDEEMKAALKQVGRKVLEIKEGRSDFHVLVAKKGIMEKWFSHSIGSSVLH